MKTFSNLILIAIIVGAGWYFRDQILFYALPPCTRPITYSIGQFDPKFGVTREYFLSAIKEAEIMWEKSAGKELFIYESNDGRMKINLVYDYRQQTSQSLQNLSGTVDSGKATYDSLKARLDQLKVRYELLKTTYDTQVREYRQKPTNSKFAEVKALEAELNRYVDEINSLVPQINQLATHVNSTVQRYNNIGSDLGEFEEGLYHSQGGKAEIDIFEFKDRAKLVRVLAHELGHALYLDHVEDPQAIMYSHNSSPNMKLTSDDLQELKDKCGIKES